MNQADVAKPKEPWLAVCLSSILPGLGQIYARCVAKGCLFAAFQIAGTWFAIRMHWGRDGDLVLAMAGFLFLLAVYVFSLVDAYRCVRKRNPEGFEQSRKGAKDPWLAVFLSNMIPGLGHFYLGKWLLGIGFLICGIVLVIVHRIWSHSLLAILGAGFSALVCYNAYALSPLRRERSRRGIILVAGLMFVLALAWDSIPGFGPPAVKPFRVASSAMEPTLLAGDRVLADTSSGYSPRRGDLVVFRSPKDAKTVFLKRVVAVEGERVEIRDGAVYVNEKRLTQHPFDGIEYLSDLGEFGVVPHKNIFVLGDNSKNSRDSRYFGPVPEKDVIGRVYRIFWPLKRRGVIE